MRCFKEKGRGRGKGRLVKLFKKSSARHSELAEESRVDCSGVVLLTRARFLGKLGMTSK